jgi:RimJ/RimL family protein N-acetyltransferase
MAKRKISTMYGHSRKMDLSPNHEKDFVFTDCVKYPTTSQTQVKLFESPRLYVRRLRSEDEGKFIALMGNPNVMALIPQKPLDQKECTEKLKELIRLEQSSDTKIWSLCKKGSDELIGICGLLKNDEYQDEIAYRILESAWGKGYGTEITKALIDYCFSEKQSDLVTADVWVGNLRSITILNKFFEVKKEFFNSEDHCTDRRYELTRKDWLEKSHSF